MSGLFIVFEGPEGAGKSTQAGLLADALQARGVSVLLTREPGGTAIGEQLRRVLLDPNSCAMLAETEALLYAAARAQHVGEVLRPALGQGLVVVCDRFVDSSLAYQGGGRGLPMRPLKQIQQLATQGLAPDLRFLLDLPVPLGLSRRFAESAVVNRLDRADRSFHERVREEYLRLARADPAMWAVVDASNPPEVVAQRVFQVVQERLGDRLVAVRTASGHTGTQPE